MMNPGLSEEGLAVASKWGAKAIGNTLARKDTWQSKYVPTTCPKSSPISTDDHREEAYAEFCSSPFYQTWDPEVLKLYAIHGLYNTTVTTPIGAHQRVAKLKLASFHEALVFAGGDVPLEAFSRLPELDERVKLHWIMSGAKGAPEFGPPGSQRERVWVRPKNASNTRINKAGHLVRCIADFEEKLSADSFRTGSSGEGA